MNGFKEWQQLFDDNVAQVWKQEPISLLKNLSMMVFCLNREISQIQSNLQLKVQCIRKQLTDEPQLGENFNQELTVNSGILKEQPNNSSPSIILSDEDLCKSEQSTGSPEIKKNRISFRYKQRGKKKLTQNDRTLTRSKLMMIATKGQQGANQESVNLLHVNNNENCLRKKMPVEICKALKSDARTPKKADSDMDTSVIESTPGVNPASFRTREVKRGMMNSKLTLTQIFSASDRENSTSNQDTGDTVMGITSLVNLLNSDASEATYSAPDGSDPEDNTCLNSAIIENQSDSTNEEVGPGNLNAFLAKAQNVPNQLEAAPVVRGKLRQQLPGWSCKDCEKFYLNQGLTANEILALTKQCSKHRGYYMPREDTCPGYWDLNLGSQESENT